MLQSCSKFKKLALNKEKIENSFGNLLEWEELPDNKMSRIKFELQDVNIFHETDWDKMNNFFVNNISKFENAFEPFIKSLK